MEPESYNKFQAAAQQLGVAHVKLAPKGYSLVRTDGKQVQWAVQMPGGQWRRISPKGISKDATRRTRLRELRRQCITALNFQRPS